MENSNTRKLEHRPLRVCIKWHEPASHASQRVMRASMQSVEESLKKNTIKIEKSNTENINWTLINHCK